MLIAAQFFREGPCVDGSELARKIFTSQIPMGCSHVFGLICAVHMTAGHNALRGSGPGHKLAFDNALALVGCPDRRSTGSALRAVRPANLQLRRWSGAISFTPRVRQVPDSIRSSPSLPTPS